VYKAGVYHLVDITHFSTGALELETVLEAKAEQKVKKPFDITVIYNGVPKEIEVQEDQAVKQVLDRAIAVFGPLPQPHVLSLYDKKGVELKDAETVEQAGIHPNEQLLLRPSEVKGG
jgi:hypothetical protein